MVNTGTASTTTSRTHSTNSRKTKTNSSRTMTMTMTMTTTTTMMRTAVAVLTFYMLIVSTRGDIRQFSGLIKATSQTIYFTEDYIMAPGFFDIEHLVFSTTIEGDELLQEQEDQQMKKYDKDEVHELDQDNEHEHENEDENQDSSQNNPNKEQETTNNDQQQNNDNDAKNNDNGGRTLSTESIVEDVHENRVLDAIFADTYSKIDVVLFHEPASCANTRSGCHWPDLGVGASDSDGLLRYCCSDEAAEAGFCEGGQQQLGRLIVNSSSFAGQHRVMKIPNSGEFAGTIKYGKLEEPKDSGEYILVIANCNDKTGRDVEVTGHYTLKSKHGFLPGEFYGEMIFFAFLTILYFVLMLGYGISMKIYEDDGIPIQKWILCSIALGLLESFFLTGDYFVWNEDGTRFWFAMYTGIFIGVLKRALSKCLIVMVSLGWGVVRDNLEHMLQIQILGVLYTIAAIASEITSRLAITGYRVQSTDEERELLDADTVMRFIVIAINVTFALWVLDALSATMQYLENMNQRRKLVRYLRLRLYLLFSFLFATVWLMLFIINAMSEQPILERQTKWAIDGLMRLNYLLVLVAVAFLWRPAPNAKEFAYVMELPALGEDENELEMTANIPSALDDDDDDEYEEEVDFAEK